MTWLTTTTITSISNLIYNNTHSITVLASFYRLWCNVLMEKESTSGKILNQALKDKDMTVINLADQLSLSRNQIYVMIRDGVSLYQARAICNHLGINETKMFKAMGEDYYDYLVNWHKEQKHKEEEKEAKASKAKPNSTISLDF